MTVSWFDDIEIQVLAGFSAADGEYGVWGVGVWGTATWGPDTVFTDVSEWVRSIDTTRKFSREPSEWEAGTATIVLKNQDGRFSPSNMSGPYVVAGVTGIRPWRPMIVNVQGTPIYTGYAIAWQEVYDQGSPGGGGANVVVQCVDEFSSLARFDGLTTAPQGAGELAGERIHRILNNAGHSGGRAIDVGRATLQATTHEQNTVVEIKLTADSDGGTVYIERDGAVTFEDRYRLVEADRSRELQGIFGDALGELPYNDIVLSYDGDHLVNIVSLSRAQTEDEREADIDPPVYTTQNETSKALYGDSRYTRTDLINDADADLGGIAELYLAAHQEAELRVEQITILPRGSNLLTAQAVDRRVRDKIRVIRRPPGGATITRDCHISGISHRISPDGTWQVAFDLLSASVYDTFEPSFWDSAEWDDAEWFF